MDSDVVDAGLEADPLYEKWLEWVESELGGNRELIQRAARAAVAAVHAGEGYAGGVEAATAAWANRVPGTANGQTAGQGQPTAAFSLKWPAIGDWLEPQLLKVSALVAGAVMSLPGLIAALIVYAGAQSQDYLGASVFAGAAVGVYVLALLGGAFVYRLFHPVSVHRRVRWPTTKEWLDRSLLSSTALFIGIVATGPAFGVTLIAVWVWQQGDPSSAIQIALVIAVGYPALTVASAYVVRLVNPIVPKPFDPPSDWSSTWSQMSDDGQVYWTGRSWVPALSSDQRWRWVGTEWEPRPSSTRPGKSALTYAMVAVWVGLATGLVSSNTGYFQGAFAVLTTMTAIATAIVAGRLSPFAWTVDMERTEGGAARTVLMWGAASGVAWGYFVLFIFLLAGNPDPFINPVVAMAAYWIALLIMAFGVWSAVAGAAPSMMAAAGTRSAEGRRWRRPGWSILRQLPRYLPVVAFAIAAGLLLMLAVPTVWLIAYLAARSAGERLGFREAFGGSSNRIPPALLARLSGPFPAVEDGSPVHREPWD